MMGSVLISFSVFMVRITPSILTEQETNTHIIVAGTLLRRRFLCKCWCKWGKNKKRKWRNDGKRWEMWKEETNVLHIKVFSVMQSLNLRGKAPNEWWRKHIFQIHNESLLSRISMTKDSVSSHNSWTFWNWNDLPQTTSRNDSPTVTVVQKPTRKAALSLLDALKY